MKIAHLTPRFLPSRGGLENMVYEIAKFSTEHGHNVKIFTSNLSEKNSTIKTRFEHMNHFDITRSIAIPLLPIQNGIINIMPQMFFDVLLDKSDIYHSYGIGSFPTLMGALKYKMKNKVVLSLISDMRSGTKSQKIIDKLTTPILNSANKLIVLTNEEKKYLLETFNLQESSISVVPPSINLEKFSNCSISYEEFRSKYKLKNNVIFFAGRIDNWHKGLDTLIKALAIIKKELEFSCIISGDDWGSKKILEDLSKKLGIEKNVIFFDPCNQKLLVEAYSQSDVFVLPSNFETFGMVLVEAMAAGTPVIGSRIGGIVDVIDDGKTGLLFPSGDHKILSEKILEILENRKLKDMMGQNAKISAKQYDTRVVGEKIHQIYRDVLE